MGWGKGAGLSYLPFFVIIISVPTELNCFHKEAFSSSTTTSSFGLMAAASVDMEEGANSLDGRTLLSTSSVGGYCIAGAEASRSGCKDPQEKDSVSNNCIKNRSIIRPYDNT